MIYKCLACSKECQEPEGKAVPFELHRGQLLQTGPQSEEMGRGTASQWVEGWPCSVPDCDGTVLIAEHYYIAKKRLASKTE